MMNNKITGLLIIVMAMMLFSISVFAANQYIRQGAIGLNNGSDWTNAFTDLPAKLVRGNTYFIADGNYAYHLFNDAVDRAKVITIKKCPSSVLKVDACQRVAGWKDDYGDEQAVFPQLNFITSDYVWNGVTGSDSNYSSYGFKVTPPSCPLASDLIGIPGVGYSSYQVTNVQVSHTAIVQCGKGDGTYSQTGIYSLARYASGASSDINISNNYLSNSATNMVFRHANRWTIENNYFDGNWSSSRNHGQQISPGGCDDFVLRGNTFRNSIIFIVGAHNPTNHRWKIYNNVVIGGVLAAGWSTATIAEYDNLVQWQVHNNTYINVDFTASLRSVVFPGLLTDVANDKSYAFNNLFYSCIGPRMDNNLGTPGGVVHDNNAYLKCMGTINNADESSPLIDDSDPFINAASNNFRLAAGARPNNRGKNLSPYFTTDKDGTPRGKLHWSIGAYQTGDPAPPKK